MDLMDLMDLKSANSTENAYVRFINISKKRVEIVWVNYEGLGVPYKELEPSEYIDINTYFRHYWVVYDCKTRARMIFFSGRSSEPKTAFTPTGPKPQGANTRKWVFIQLPVLSLKEICIQKLRNMGLDSDKFKNINFPSFLKGEYDEFLRDPNILRRETERKRRTTQVPPK